MRVLNRDSYGRETIWQCSDCGEPFTLGWGSRCNRCITAERRHRELLASIVGIVGKEVTKPAIDAPLRVR